MIARRIESCLDQVEDVNEPESTPSLGSDPGSSTPYEHNRKKTNHIQRVFQLLDIEGDHIPECEPTMNVF